MRLAAHTFHGDVDAGCKKETAKAVVEDLIPLQGSCGVVCDFDSWRRGERQIDEMVLKSECDIELKSTVVGSWWAKSTDLQRSRQRCGSCAGPGGCWC